MNVDAQAVGMLVGCVTLGTLVWKMGATNALFTKSVETLNKEIEELKAIRKEVQEIPLLMQRVGQLEKFMSSFPKSLQEQRDREEKLTRKSQGEFG